MTDTIEQQRQQPWAGRGDFDAAPRVQETHITKIDIDFGNAVKLCFTFLIAQIVVILLVGLVGGLVYGLLYALAERY